MQGSSNNVVLAGLARIAARQDLLIVMIIIATVAMMVLPMPTVVADALIAINIGFALVLILLALYVRSPVEFSTLPSVILITTAFRLSISITTSRLVLVQGDAGLIIRTFGDFVIAGNVVVGLVVYLITTVVQFVVITKGAERVAEVAARFTLDALPGKQISIDTDVRNGDLTQAEARKRRSMLERESQLYGAMDGAMKFVKGDAIASLVIIAVNLIGGIAIGCLQRGMPFGKAAQTYALLAVGDGLIAQIPALLVSLTAGIVVTRATTEGGGNLGEDIVRQVTSHAQPMQVAGVVLIGLGFVPGFPIVLFAALGTLLAVGGFLVSRYNRNAAAKEFEATTLKAGATPEAAHIEVQVGSAFLEQHDLLRERLASLHRTLEADLGIPVPKLRLVSSPGLAPDGVALHVDHIPRLVSKHADVDGVIGQVKAGVLKCSAQFIGIQEAQAMVARMEANYGDLVREAVKAAPLPRFADVIRRLVEEQVPVTNMRAVLEAVAEWGPREQSSATLADHVRVSLGRQICHRWANGEGHVRVLLLETAVDEAIRSALRSDQADPQAAFSDKVVSHVVASVRQKLGEAPDNDGDRGVVVLAAFDTRRHLRALLQRHGVDISVLAHAELAPEFTTTVMGTIGLPPGQGAGLAPDPVRRPRPIPTLAA